VSAHRWNFIKWFVARRTEEKSKETTRDTHQINRKVMIDIEAAITGSRVGLGIEGVSDQAKI
jgi:hypothetical protein